jgi:hypothetical protein
MTLTNRHNCEGSTLLVTVVITAIVGVTLASFLGLVSSQNVSVMRSLAWNTAVGVAEAGIEEAMAHLNRNGTNRTADSWTVVGTNVVKERTIGADRYRVSIPIAMDPPVITSEGYVLNFLKSEYLPQPRTVRVGTTNQGIFVKAMVAKGEIDLSGNNIKTDSFDSDDPDHSNNGRYDVSKAKSNGDVATNSSFIDSLDVWNADIYGRVSTGPGGTVRIGPNGAVGDAAWHAAGNQGIKPGWAKDDMNVQFPEVERPFNSALPPLDNVTIGGTKYAYVAGGGNFELPSISLSGKDKILVTGKAVLLVRGNVSMSGQSLIEIEPGASLQLYVEGASTSIGGQGIMNANAKAASFGYWGMKSNTTVSISGNAAFTGTIYAPDAALTMNGGGNNTYDFVGATISNTVKMNGHFQFHYDEALGKIGPRSGYTITSWNEIASSEL